MTSKAPIVLNPFWTFQHCKYKLDANSFPYSEYQRIENSHFFYWLRFTWIFIFFCASILRHGNSKSFSKCSQSEQSIGRQEPLNCQCEGLLVFKQVRMLSLHTHCFIFENHLVLLKILIFFNELFLPKPAQENTIKC